MNTKSELRVVFFRTDRGNDPVRDWLEGLGERDEMIIDTDITVVAENWSSVLGTSLGKKLQGEEGLWEIRSRISGGKRIARVLFTVEAGEIILLHGFVKKSQRTPRKDLRIARRRNRLWKGRAD
ncbi:MAG: type II toxin-antitoxin system RelE/ParE family toxin [Candidatus Poribacteria bacterium]|nr:type II toxin-antitoxin system RelE/ParE family toxin [Candidatus Poribacteria bacterium]